MKKPIPPMGIRPPEEMKLQIKRSASENRRSLNSEVLTLIEEGFRYRQSLQQHQARAQ